MTHPWYALCCLVGAFGWLPMLLRECRESRWWDVLLTVMLMAGNVYFAMALGWSK